MSSSGSLKVIGDFLVKGVLGFGAGILLDAIIEVSRMPILNDSGLFGNAGMSNFEFISYAAVAGTVGVSLIELFTNVKIFGISKDILPTMLGYGIGIQQYETGLAEKLHIRELDPYGTVGGLIPKF